MQGNIRLGMERFWRTKTLSRENGDEMNAHVIPTHEPT